MKKQIGKIREDLLEFINLQKEHTKTCDLTEKAFSQGAISRQNRNKIIDTIQKQKKDELKEIYEKISSAKERFNASVDKWAVLDGKNINIDLNLLDGSIKLTSNDLSQLSEKHKNNVLMQRTISTYADEYKVDYNKAVSMPEDMKTGFQALCDNCLLAIRNPLSLSAAFMEDDSWFDTLLPPALKSDIQLD